MELNEKLARNGFSGKNGLYVSVIPDRSSKKIFRMIAHSLGVSCNEDDLHCTVMYSTKLASPREFGPSIQDTFRARIKGIEMFGENQDFLVVTLESYDLQAEHKILDYLGAEHHWPKYNPHVTLAKVETKIDDNLVEDVLQIIKGSIVTFGDYSWDDLED